MKLKTKFLISFFLIAIITGCKKEKVENNYLKVNQTMAAIPTEIFDWERADYVPTPPGTSPILVPWASGSNQLFPSDIAFDFKKNDGWNMVYNTFNTTHLASPNFFALYNKYRGILRFYLYIPPHTPVPSSYFSDGLSTTGTFKTTILNFSNDIANIQNAPVTSTTKIQNYQLQSTGAWYTCQYELAYDPNVSNARQQNLNFIWNTASTSISNIKLNGQSNSTLSGTIGTESPGGFNLGKLIGQATQGAVYVAGFKTIEALKIGNEGIQKAMLDGAKSGLSGAVKGFLSAILGGTPSSPQMINLTLNTKIDLTGTLLSNKGISNPTLVVPGTQLGSSTIGYLPIYNKILGVVNVKKDPVIKYKIDSTRKLLKLYRKFLYGYFFTHNFSYSHNESDIIYNPEVTNDGTIIKLIRSDIIIPYQLVDIERINTTFGSKTDRYRGNPFFDDKETLPQYYGKEQIGANNYIVGGTPSISGSDIKFKVISDIVSVYHDLTDNIDYNGAAVRYTFLIIPPKGTTPITIVKTFKALLIEQ